MIEYKVSTYSGTGKRPSGHLNLGTIADMLDHLLKQGAGYSEPEKQIEIDYNLSGTTAKKVAKKMKAGNFLSNYDYAVCHKIPYSAVEKALIKLMNAEAAGTATPKMWDTFARMNQAVAGPSYASSGYNSGFDNQATALSNAVKNSQHNLAVALANAALNEFDKAADNLFFGFGKTNSSIGDSIDLHFNLDDPSNDVPPTPRGLAMRDALNNFETALGLSATTTRETLSGGIRWVMTSTTYGTGKNNTGYVSTTPGW
jgi:hypothetical protein